jgi:hypothetical protein
MLSEHPVANPWWEPSSMPAWLTKEFYIAKVQPKLTPIKVREIAQGIWVSHPNAALIRSGRQLPHARHWEVLAKLAKALPEE